VRGYWRIFRGVVEEEYLIIYPGGIVLREIKRDVYIAAELINWPPNHPGAVTFIKPKNKRLGCEPMRKH